MNNRGFPSPRPSSPGLGGGGSNLGGIGIGFLNAAIQETEDRPGRPRPLRFPKVPYRGTFKRLAWGVNPYLRALDALNLLQPYLLRPGQEGGYNMTGWTKCCDTGNGILDAVIWNQGNSTSSRPVCDYADLCGLVGQVPDLQMGEAIPFTDQSGGIGSWRFRSIYFGTETSDNPWRMTIQQGWALKFNKGDNPNPSPPAYKAPAPAILLGPDPNDLVPPVRLLPRIKDNPHRHTGPRKRKRPRWHPHWDPPFRKPGKPPFGKEKKTEPSRWEKALWAIWSAATEVPDWVDAFWDAFPEWFQKKHYFEPGSLTVDRKVKLMLENLHLMDIEVAIKNVLHNLGEDALAGKIIGLLDSVGVGVGFNGVPFLKNPHTGMWN